jgi:hypothetical protein
MALFNTNLLSISWDMRVHELNAQRLQRHNDMLYNYLRRDLMTRSESLEDDLLEVIRTADSKLDLEIPIWSFNRLFFAQNPATLPPRELAHFQGWIRQKGYDWSIGRVHEGFDPATIELVDWGWEWQSPPVTVHQIVQKTDLLQRLALLFGDDYRIEARIAGATKQIREPFESYVYTTELRLHYYPKGLPTALQVKRETVRTKYAGSNAPVGEEYVHLWTGVPVKAEPSTPPPAPIPPSPPVLPRRSNGGGIQAEEDGVNRQLDFTIQVYEGEDVFERAARDTVTDLIRSEANGSLRSYPQGCYCGYAHSDSE